MIVNEENILQEPVHKKLQVLLVFIFVPSMRSLRNLSHSGGSLISRYFVLFDKDSKNSLSACMIYLELGVSGFFRCLLDLAVLCQGMNIT